MKQSTNEYSAIVKHSSLTYFSEEILFSIFILRSLCSFRGKNVSALLNESRDLSAFKIWFKYANLVCNEKVFSAY